MANKPRIDRVAGTITLDAWLIFDATGFKALRQEQPPVGRGSRRIKISLTVPLAIFKEPELAASITVAGDFPVETRLETVQEVERAISGIPGAVFEVVTPVACPTCGAPPGEDCGGEECEAARPPRDVYRKT